MLLSGSAERFGQIFPACILCAFRWHYCDISSELCKQNLSSCLVLGYYRGSFMYQRSFPEAEKGKCPFLLLLTSVDLLKLRLAHSPEKFWHKYLMFELAVSQKCLTARWLSSWAKVKFALENFKHTFKVHSLICWGRSLRFNFVLGNTLYRSISMGEKNWFVPKDSFMKSWDEWKEILQYFKRQYVCYDSFRLDWPYILQITINFSDLWDNRVINTVRIAGISLMFLSA